MKKSRTDPPYRTRAVNYPLVQSTQCICYLFVTWQTYQIDCHHIAALVLKAAYHSQRLHHLSSSHHESTSPLITTVSTVQDIHIILLDYSSTLLLFTSNCLNYKLNLSQAVCVGKEYTQGSILAWFQTSTEGLGMYPPKGELVYQ